MSDKQIKEEIYKHYSIHRNTKLKLNNSEYTFKMRLGDCTSIDIEYPVFVKRELILEKIIN